MPANKEDFNTQFGKKRIFFATVPNHLAQFKDNLISELEQNGHIVMEADGNVDHISSIPEVIAQFDIAVHLLSDRDETITSNGIGIEEEQVLFTAKHHQNQKLISNTNEELFQVFAWHPKHTSESIFEEGHLSKHLHNIQQMEDVELVRTNFEDFKYYLLKKLEQTNEEKDNSDYYIKGERNINLYFLYDASDSRYAEQYVKYLKKRGYNVLTPQFDGDIMTIRQKHNNCLKDLDLAIIFANSVSVNWVNMKIMDLLKSPGLGREKEILGKAIFIPEHKVKMCPLAGRGFDIIPFDENSPEYQIDDFLNGKLL